MQEIRRLRRTVVQQQLESRNAPFATVNDHLAHLLAASDPLHVKVKTSALARMHSATIGTEAVGSRLACLLRHQHGVALALALAFALASNGLRSTISPVGVPDLHSHLVWRGVKLIHPVLHNLLSFSAGEVVVCWQLVFAQVPITNLEQHADEVHHLGQRSTVAAFTAVDYYASLLVQNM